MMASLSRISELACFFGAERKKEQTAIFCVQQQARMEIYLQLE
jgi:hypothetical protein